MSKIREVQDADALPPVIKAATEPLILAPGIHTISMEEYLAIPAFSSGLAHTILTASPRHAWTDSWLNPNLEPWNSEVADIGTYAHACLLEGGTSALHMVDADDWRTKAAQGQRDQARAEGKLPILARKVSQVEAMVKAARAYIAASEIAGIFDSGKAEQTLIWSESMVACEVLCKARPDWLSETILLHYKTTKASVNPLSFSRTASNMGYDVAMMFYLRGLEAVKPDHEAQHFLLAQEQIEPFACKLFDLSAPLADVAAHKVSRAINAWASCMNSGKWPAYDGAIHSIELKPWDLQQAVDVGDINGLGYDPEIAGEFGVQA